MPQQYYRRDNPINSAIRTYGLLADIDRRKALDEERQIDRAHQRQKEQDALNRQEEQDRLAREDRQRQIAMQGTPEEAATDRQLQRDRNQALLDKSMKDLENMPSAEESKKDRELARKDKESLIQYRSGLAATSQMQAQREAKDQREAAAAKKLDYLSQQQGWEDNPKMVKEYADAHKEVFGYSPEDMAGEKVGKATQTIEEFSKKGQPFAKETKESWGVVLKNKIDAPADEQIEAPLVRRGIDGKKITLPKGTIILKERELIGVEPDPEGKGGYMVLKVKAKLPDGKIVEYGAFKTGTGTAGKDDDPLFIPSESVAQKYAGFSGARRIVLENPAFRENAGKSAKTTKATSKTGTPAGLKEKEYLQLVRDYVKIINKEQDAKKKKERMSSDEVMAEAIRRVRETHPDYEAEAAPIPPQDRPPIEAFFAD